MYKKIKKCRSCDSHYLSSILDLGKQPLANALIKEKDFIKNSLRVNNLQICKLVQLNHTVNPNIISKVFMGNWNLKKS